MKRVVFVCTGNTCRSPMAKGIFEAELKKRGLSDISADSCGIFAMAGDEASQNAVEAAKELGADIRPHRSKPLNPYMFNEALLFVCMTQSHAQALKGYVAQKNILVLDIPDPFGGDLDAYRKSAQAIVEKMDCIFEILEEKDENL